MISETFCENKAPRRNRQRRSCTDLAVEVVDFVSDVGDVLPHVFAILLRLGRLHRLTSGSRAELLQLYICSTHCCVIHKHQKAKYTVHGGQFNTRRGPNKRIEPSTTTACQ